MKKVWLMKIRVGRFDQRPRSPMWMRGAVAAFIEITFPFATGFRCVAAKILGEKREGDVERDLIIGPIRV